MAKFVGNTFLSDVHNGGTPAFERSYTTTAGLLSEIGDPTTPGAGVTWTTTTGPLFAVPNTAFWVAERFTISGVTSDWQRYPVQAKDGGIPFVTADNGNIPLPTLNDSAWLFDVIAAVEAFTGRDYTTQKEFGYGTVVVITYTNITTAATCTGAGSSFNADTNTCKLSGKFVRSGTTDTWVAPTQFIDGDLFVDGTVAADKIQANAIDSSKLKVSGTLAITPGTVGAGSSATTGERIVITSAKIEVFDSSNNVRVTIGDLT